MTVALHFNVEVTGENLAPALGAALSMGLAWLIGRPILRLTLDALWLLWAHDDLVLDGGVLARVPLTAGAARLPRSA